MEYTTTTVASNLSHNKSAMPDDVQITTFVWYQVLLPIICMLGIVGNGLSLCVLTRREMAAATTCFLTALAVSDLLLLILQIPFFFQQNWAIADSISYKRFIRMYALIRYVMNNVFITCTGWLTVAVTIERFISLRFMFHPLLVCTIFRARLAIIGIFVASFIFHFSKFFDYVPNENLLSSRDLIETDLLKSPEYDTFLHITNIFLAAIIPVFSLIIANSFLIYFLATHRRRMLRHKGSSTSNMTSVDMLHVSTIVVATVLVFLLCHSVGVYLALVIVASRGRTNVIHLAQNVALKHTNTLLVMINSSVNFLLYCAISCKFRKTFIIVFKGHLIRRDTCTSAIPLSENSTGNTGTIPRTSNGKIYTVSSKTAVSNGSSPNGHNVTKTEV